MYYYDTVIDKIWQKDFFKEKKMQEATLGGEGKPKTKLLIKAQQGIICSYLVLVDHGNIKGITEEAIDCCMPLPQPREQL